jgi:hypothetical protein
LREKIKAPHGRTRHGSVKYTEYATREHPSCDASKLPRAQNGARNRGRRDMLKTRDEKSAFGITHPAPSISGVQGLADLLQFPLLQLGVARLGLCAVAGRRRAVGGRARTSVASVTVATRLSVRAASSATSSNRGRVGAAVAGRTGRRVARAVAGESLPGGLGPRSRASRGPSWNGNKRLERKHKR